MNEEGMIKSILIVDDQSEVRELVSVTLEIGDYQILTAENGYQALEQIRAHRPDLVLLDVMMPGGPDGLEICRQIKSQYATSGVYVIMLTAKGQEADQRAGGGPTGRI